jgi:type I restriction enzyme R subunit
MTNCKDYGSKLLRRAAEPARADDHDYSEAETRDYFIDLLLKEARLGARSTGPGISVTGMPNNMGEGFVDYVLWG